MRELPRNSKIVATHTDSLDVLIWDVETQPNRHAVLGATESRSDLNLLLICAVVNTLYSLEVMHTVTIAYASFVLSGGKDKSIVLWSIQDHISTFATDSGGMMINLPRAQRFKQEVSIKDTKIPSRMYNSALQVLKSSVVLVMILVLFYGMQEPGLLQ